MKVSLITPCLNSEHTLRRTFESVREQNYQDIEYIVIDGFSLDKTVEIIGDNINIITKWVSEKDCGVYDAINKGIKLSTGDIIGTLHSDDVFSHASSLYSIVNSFKDTDVEACYGDIVYCSKYNPDKVIRYWRAGKFSRKKLQKGWMPPHPTFYVRRKLYEQYGAFDTQYRIAADYDCMLRLLSKVEGKVIYMPEVLVRMRLGGASNRSFGNIVLKSWEDYRVLKANKMGGVGALAMKNFSKLGQFFQR